MKLSKLVETEYENISSEHIQILQCSNKNTIEELMRLWKETVDETLLLIKTNHPRYEHLSSYNSFIERLQFSKPNYTAEDITGFCFAVDEKEKDYLSYVGSFLSALINYHAEINPSEKEYQIILDHLDYTFDYLCYNNTANVRVIAEAGSFFCFQMTSGTVIAERKVGRRSQITGGTGFLYGGKLILNGDVTGDIGSLMSGGEIIVNGNVYKGDIGSDMMGGEIIVNGDFLPKGGTGEVGERMIDGKIHIFGKGWTLAPNIHEGTVYRQGKQIFPKE